LKDIHKGTRMTRKIYFFATLVMLVSIQTFSADLLYPELHVVPSAEDRLRQASKNDDGFFMRNWQLLTPSVALIASGVMLQSDQDINTADFNTTTAYEDKKSSVDNAAMLQILVGASFAGLTYYWDRNDVYGKAASQIGKMPSKSKRDRLARVRIAEETMYHRYKLMKKTRWFMALAGIGLSQMETEYAGKDAKLVAGIAAFTSLLPMIFKHRYEEIYLDYDRYKNRVYGPVVSSGLIQTANNEVVPGLQLSLKF